MINPFCKIYTDPRGPGKIFNGGSLYLLKSPKMIQKGLPTRRPNARNVFEYRSHSGFASPLAVPSDGKPVGFIPDLLNEMKCSGGLRQC